ncbi:MAG: O-antigen ligase family protein [Ramlibacter sp.]|nr:O-antigen ligase family protein [Ramlibacter sp.]
MSERISWESLRPWPVYLTAAMLPFSLAATNIFKLLMVLFAVAALVIGFRRREPMPQWRQLRTPAMVAAMLVVLSLSLLYTSAPLTEALNDLNKYGKLLLIPLVLLLVRKRDEALFALGLYAVGESFVVLSSYLLSAGLPLPWVVKPLSTRVSVGVVYSSYLDQSLMTVGLATLAWHLRHDFPSRHGVRIALGVVLLCAVNVLLFLPGRSAQVALLLAMALALFWATPGRGRPAAVLLPLLLLGALMALSPHFKDRVAAVVTESIAYSNGDRAPTSSGARLNLWQRSVEAIREKPLAGHGLGSWNAVYRRLEGPGLSPVFVNLRNPHQEYLLWGVQLGLVGVALLLAFEVMLLRDGARFRSDVRHATWSIAAIFAVVCLFNSSLFDALIGDYFCMVLGLLLALGVHTPRPQASA